MYRYRSIVLVAVTVLAAFGPTGCSRSQPAAPPPVALSTPAPSTAVAAQQAAALPVPEALTEVLYRLADTAVPGAEKLQLIEGAAGTDAETLDRFTTALKDGGHTPLSFNAADIAWSDRNPGNAVANVDVTTANADGAAFSFPMEFKPRGEGWQLSEKTAEMLLAFGSARTGVSPGAAPGR